MCPLPMPTNKRRGSFANAEVQAKSNPVQQSGGYGPRPRIRRLHEHRATGMNPKSWRFGNRRRTDARGAVPGIRHFYMAEGRPCTTNTPIIRNKKLLEVGNTLKCVITGIHGW